MRIRNRLILRSVAGGVAVVALGVLGLVGVRGDFPRLESQPTLRTVDPVPADQVRVCDGPLYELGADADSATELTAAGKPTVSSAVDGDAELEQDSLSATKEAGDVDGPVSLTLRSQGKTDLPVTAGSQSQKVDSDTVFGFAASECQETRPDAWLVAGSTDVGRTSVLLLNNPSDVDATVDLELVSGNGAVDAPGAHSIQVGAGTQKAMSLAGLMKDAPLTAVHVTSSGAEVQAAMQQTTIRGLNPSGADAVGPAASPSKTVTVPGVRVYDGQPKVSSDGYDDRRPSVRLVTPDGSGAHATITVRDADGSEADTESVDVKSGAVSEFPLSGLDAGTYTVEVEADRPVVASARTSVEFGKDGKEGDFSWFASASELTSAFIVSPAPGQKPTLVLQNPGDEEVEVDVDGDTVTIAPGAFTTADASSTVHVDPSGPVTAAVGYSGGDGVSSYAVTPPKPASEPVTVRVR